MPEKRTRPLKPERIMSRDELRGMLDAVRDRAAALDDRRRTQIGNQIEVINRLLKRIDLLNEFIFQQGHEDDAKQFITDREQLAANGSPRLHINRDGVLRMFDSDGKEVWPTSAE
jgi:hypothetical protein